MLSFPSMTREVHSHIETSLLSYEAFSGSIQNSSEIPSTYQIQTRSRADGTQKDDKAKTRRHPTYSKMIDEAISEKYTQRKGTSLQSIKKYLEEKYQLDVQKLAVRKRICKYLNESVGEGGHLRQIKGHGANGSFALKDKNSLRKDMNSRRKTKKKESQVRQVVTKSQNVNKLEPEGKKRKLMNPVKSSTFAEAPKKVARMRVK